MVKKLTAGLAFAAVLSLGLAGVAAAEDTASAGNGGTSSANADGGAVTTGALDSGESTGSVVGVAVQDAIVSGDDIAAKVIAAIRGE